MGVAVDSWGLNARWKFQQQQMETLRYIKIQKRVIYIKQNQLGLFRPTCDEKPKKSNTTLNTKPTSTQSQPNRPRYRLAF